MRMRFVFRAVNSHPYKALGASLIEDMKILPINPLDQFGSPLEIVGLFGGKIQYQQALIETVNEIYRRVA